MIEQVLIYSCDAEGCGAQVKRAYPIPVGGLLYKPEMVPSGKDIEGWDYADHRHFCSRHEVTVKITVRERAK